MSQITCDVDKMLDVYIYDYLLKRKLHASAKSFQTEGKVFVDSVAIDVPGGFLFEWWSVFWDIFITRTNKHHSEVAASYIEAQLMKAGELQLQQEQYLQKIQQNQQMQMQQLVLQRQNQQQQEHQRQELQQQLKQPRDGSRLIQDTANRLIVNNSLNRQNPTTATQMFVNMYEENFKLPFQRDVLSDVLPKKRLIENVSQLPDPNHTSMFRAAAAGGQYFSQTLHGSPGDNSESTYTQYQSHQLRGSQNLKGGMQSTLNSRVSRTEGSLMGIADQGTGNLNLKGWPLTGLDQLRSRLLQQPKSSIQLPQALNQFQLQHQLMRQAPQNLGIPSADDVTCIRPGVPFNNQNMNIVKDNQLNIMDVSNVESLVAVCCPVFPHVDADMPMKQQFLQHPFSSQHSQNSDHQIQQQDKLASTGIINTDGYMSNNFQANDQATKNCTERKRKQPLSSSGLADSTRTADSPGSSTSPSTPTHAPEDADVDHFMDAGTLDDVESFLCPDESDMRDKVGLSSDPNKGLTLKEIRLIPASKNKVECCRFSFDGKLLAIGGHDKKATVWCTESFTVKSTLDEHSQWITDVCFSPRTLKIATSSGDRTVKVWDVDCLGHSLRTFMGHSTGVTSLDFHPSKDDLICSCDISNEIRYWSIKNGSCVGIFKGGATQLRFQPNNGRILAAAVGNFVSIIDVETQVCKLKLQGHKNHIHSVCWDPSGEYLASVSDDQAKVWKVNSGSKGDCIHELHCNENKFCTCVFHPTYPSLLIIGSYESLELWDMTENKTRALHAHDKVVSALAASNVTGLVASAGNDECVKLWQ